MRLLPPLMLVILACAAPVRADMPGPTTLTLTAEARVDRVPDIAMLSGGVVTQAPTAAAALAENARRMTAVIAAVRRAGIAERDIQTAGFNVQPQYRYGDNHAPVLTGYQATNTVTLKLRKLSDTGVLIDALVGVGANQISGPTFAVDGADAATDAARTAAVATARARAELYARAAGLHVTRIRSISEGDETRPAPRPLMRMAAMAADAPTPVEPGEIALTAAVTVVFELN